MKLFEVEVDVTEVLDVPRDVLVPGPELLLDQLDGLEQRVLRLLEVSLQPRISKEFGSGNQGFSILSLSL